MSTSDSGSLLSRPPAFMVSVKLLPTAMGLLLWGIETTESPDDVTVDRSPRAQPSCASRVCLNPCAHARCSSVANWQWCRRWALVLWVLTDYWETEYVESALVDVLGPSARYWGSLCFEDGKYWYRVLVHVDLQSRSQEARLYNLAPWSMADTADIPLSLEDCALQRFRCCRNFLTSAVPEWMWAIDGDDSELFGEPSLCGELLASISDCIRQTQIRG